MAEIQSTQEGQNRPTGCAVAGCQKKRKGKYCDTHQKQFKRGVEPYPIVSNAWTEEEFAFLRAWYADRQGKIDLNELAAAMGRSRAAVALKASRLGLTIIGRKWKKSRRKYATNEELRKAISEWSKRSIQENGHPRGFLGGHHSEATKFYIAMKSATRWMTITKEQITARSDKWRATVLKNYGRPSVPRTQNTYSRCKRGKRADLGNQFFRSAWEANYARYLNWLVGNGQIVTWKYEPKTFIFEGIRKGTMSYTPDFVVVENNGEIVYHEVKGWMDATSKTRLKRMKKYFPEVKVIVIASKDYYAIANKLGRIIPGWE